MTMGGVLHLPVIRLLQAVNYLLTMELALAVLTLALLSQEATMVSIYHARLNYRIYFIQIYHRFIKCECRSCT